MIRSTVAAIVHAAKVVGAVARGRSPKWPGFVREWRKLAKNQSCRVCGGTKRVTPHHVKPFHEYPEFELDMSNVEPACEQNNCHRLIGHKGNFRRINPWFREDADQIRQRIEAMP